MQYLEILQQGKTFHSLLGKNKHKLASKLGVLSTFNFSSSSQYFQYVALCRKVKWDYAKITDNEIFSNSKVFDTFFLCHKEQIPKMSQTKQVSEILNLNSG